MSEASALPTEPPPLPKLKSIKFTRSLWWYWQPEHFWNMNWKQRHQSKPFTKEKERNAVGVVLEAIFKSYLEKSKYKWFSYFLNSRLRDCVSEPLSPDKHEIVFAFKFLKSWCITIYLPHLVKIEILTLIQVLNWSFLLFPKVRLIQNWLLGSK